jgi:outer membrane protein TolC
VLARRAAVEVARAAIAETEERQRADRARADAGAIPPFYVQRDQAELANAQQQLTNAQRDVELSLLQLRTVMGVHPDSRLDVVGPLPFEPAAALLERLAGPGGSGSETAGGEPEGPSKGGAPTRDAPTLSLSERYRSRLLAAAEGQRPELRAARLRVEQAGQGVGVARSAYRPQVGVGAMFDFMDGTHVDPFGGTSFGLTASLPLLDGGLRRANTRSAEADQRNRQAEYERALLEIAQQVGSALLSLGAAEQNVTTAQTAVRAAQAEYTVGLQRYQSGRGVLVEVLDALAARTRAETNVVQALYEYNVARDQLRRAVGEPVTAASPGSGEGHGP